MLNFEDEITIHTEDDYCAEEDDAMWHVEYQVFRVPIGIV